MGLDVTAYAGLKKVEGVKYIEGEVYGKDLEPLEHGVDYDFVARHNSDFAGRAADIQDGGVYKAAEEFGFRAGAYSGYNRWREKLAEIAGYPAKPTERYGKEVTRYDAGAWASLGGPFWELIMFSDCEGVIGTAISKKLAADFAQFSELAASVEEHDFHELFKEWRKAFEIASNDGAVKFH